MFKAINIMSFEILKRNRRSASCRLLTIAFPILLFVVTMPSLVHSQNRHKNDFADYCRGSLDDEARHTVRIIMRTLKEDDFQQADKQLKQYKNLSLPDENIISVEPLRNLKHLIGLNLAKNKIANPEPLGGLTGIETVLLHDNQIEDVEFLGNMSNLKRLNLSGNLLTDVSDLQNNATIVNLNLGRNSNIKDVSFLHGFRLVELDLNNTSTASSIRNIMPQPDLTTLNLSGVGLVEISEFGRDGNLPKIRKLLLGDNKIESIEPLKDLTSLRALDLSGNPLSDIAALGNHKNLVALNISNIKSTKPQSTLAELSGILELYAEACELNEVSFLGKMNDKMRTLDLRNNKISDVSPLYRFSDIKVLRLEGNPIADIDLSWLQSLNQLQDFDIDVLEIKSLAKRRELIEFRANILERKRILK